MKAADELAKHVGVKPACAALEVSRSTLLPSSRPINRATAAPPDARPGIERDGTRRGLRHAVFGAVRGPLTRRGGGHAARRRGLPVQRTHDDRVLASEVPVQERHAAHPPEYKKPELMATASWDITLCSARRSGAITTSTDGLYSRYVVGWMVADRENSALAGRLIQQSCLKHGVQPRVLTLHSDRGAPMTSQCTAQLLADLGVTRSLSRPQVSDDNPFSEAQFKTLKYHPSFPGRFGDQGQADVLSIVLPLLQCRAPPWRHLDGAGPLRERSAGRNPCSAKHGPHPDASEVCRSPNRSRRPSSSILPSLPSPHRTLLSN